MTAIAIARGLDWHAAEHAALTYKIPYILAQSAVPVCLVPNGTVATNGIITLGTALPTTYSGGVWLRLPANAVAGGAAGLYWAVMSSTTQGQVYTNFSDPATEFIPSIPTGTLVDAVGSNAAYTQATAADVTLVNATLPGGALGANGSIREYVKWCVNNSAGGKQGKTTFGSTLAQTTGSLTTIVGRHEFLVIQNRGSAALQSAGSDNAGISTAFNASNRSMAVNTASNTAIVLSAQLATATDYMIVDSLIIEVLPS